MNREIIILLKKISKYKIEICKCRDEISHDFFDITFNGFHYYSDYKNEEDKIFDDLDLEIRTYILEKDVAIKSRVLNSISEDLNEIAIVFSNLEHELFQKEVGFQSDLNILLSYESKDNILRDPEIIKKLFSEFQPSNSSLKKHIEYRINKINKLTEWLEKQKLKYGTQAFIPNAPTKLFWKKKPTFYFILFSVLLNEEYIEYKENPHDKSGEKPNDIYFSEQLKSFISTPEDKSHKKRINKSSYFTKVNKDEISDVINGRLEMKDLEKDGGTIKPNGEKYIALGKTLNKFYKDFFQK